MTLRLSAYAEMDRSSRNAILDSDDTPETPRVEGSLHGTERPL
jgi:hypothetical protein